MDEACEEGNDGMGVFHDKEAEVAPNFLRSYKGWCSEFWGICIPYKSAALKSFATADGIRNVLPSFCHLQFRSP